MKETKFKQTEVGMIPCDWEVKTFCELFEVLPNNTLSRAELNKEYGSYKNVHYGDILVEFGEWIDCSNVGLPFINSNAKFNHTVLQDGDIVIADTAEDETVGKSTEITNAKNKKIVSGLHTIPIRPKIKFAPKWLGYYINSACWHDQILPFITGTKVSAISKAAVSQTKLFFSAKIEEQQRIANALSDVDTLITNLEKLIAKKKNIKQGAMQQLLTGKKRLPGFGSDERRMECHSERSAKREESSGYKMTELGMVPSDWEVKTISQVGKIIGGGTPSTFNSAYWNGSVQWFTPAELSKAGKYVSKSERTITKLGVENCSAKILPAGTILLTTRASIGTSAILKAPACTNQGFQSLVVNSENSNEFLYYLLSTKVDEMMSLASGSTFLEISPKKLGGIQLQIPSSRAEQTAIANVLSDMDAEISALETKLAKYRTLKTGMMQQLLTGKIRLL